MRLRKGDHTVLVSPQGGSILSWQYREHQILGPAHVERIGGELKDRGETHWCFPNFGSVPEGVKPTYSKHGYLRNTLLTPREFINDNDYAQFILPDYHTWTYTEIEVTIKVLYQGIRTWMSAINRGVEPIPVLPASHPYFATPKDGLVVMMGDEMIAQAHPNNFALGVSTVAKILPRTGKVTINLVGIGMVELVMHHHCTHIAIWSDNPTQYVCVEPIFGTPGTFGSDECTWLKQGESTFCQVDFDFRPY